MCTRKGYAASVSRLVPATAALYFPLLGTEAWAEKIRSQPQTIYSEVLWNLLLLILCHCAISIPCSRIHNQRHSKADRNIIEIHNMPPYPAASSIFSIKIPYPVVGSFTST